MLGAAALVLAGILATAGPTAVTASGADSGLSAPKAPVLNSGGDSGL
ncbi:hypothetical protein HerbRD11066_40220 [Herbidospora sp. RD11066]